MKSKCLFCVLLIFTLVFSSFSEIPALAQDDNSKPGKYVLHIVWDGISESLYSGLKAEGVSTPHLDELLQRGNMITNLRTTVPSYGGAQAALVTGAYPGTNNFTYRYYDKDSDAIISAAAQTYQLQGQTVFEAVYQQSPDYQTLVSGFSVATLSLENRGVSKTDDNHRLIEYKNGDNLVSFNTTGNDIIAAINSIEGLPEYTLAYSNDVKMLYWNSNALADPAVTSQKLADTFTQLDGKLGEVIHALKEKGIYDNTIILLHSLSGVYTMQNKINGTAMAADITASTGVPTTFGTVAADTKAVIVKAYIMKYAQLSFTNRATQEDWDKVLAYLSDPSTSYGRFIKEIADPADYHAPAVFADYLLNPLEEYTFSAASTGNFRTDDLDDLNQFCIISGCGVMKGSLPGNPGITDILPTVCSLLGLNPPQNNEGTVWDIFDMEPPTVSITVDGSKDPTGAYTGIVQVTVNASDNKGIAEVQYSTGVGWLDYEESFTVDTDCTIQVRATDMAGNVSGDEINIAFQKLIQDVTLTGDYQQIGEYCYTDSSVLTVSGTLVEENGAVITINGEPVTTQAQHFSKEITLQDGFNEIIVQVTRNEIGNTVKYRVLKVFNPNIASVRDGQVLSAQDLLVAGTVVPGSSVTVNNVAVAVDDTGAYQANIRLQEGINRITVNAVVGSYEKATNISVEYYTPVTLSITNINDRQIFRTPAATIKGTVDKACSITVNGKPALLDENLNYTGIVMLNLGVNTVQVEASYRGVVTAKTIKLVRIRPEDVYTVYINWDGFAQYYYDLANKDGRNGTPVLNSLMKEGVSFTNAYSGIPAITNSMQGSILSGAWPNVTGNCYRYYDKDTKTVVQFTRENKAENIAEAALRQGLTTASVNQFMLQNRGTTPGDATKPYIDAGGAYEARFDAAIRLIQGEPVGDGASAVQLDEIPRFLALYMDDLDGIGHNEVTTYGVPVSATEEGRKAAVLERLRLMDAKLGEFIDACKERGIYDNMAFVLTTDHGMAPFGQQGTQEDPYTYSKLPDLIATLGNLGYKAEVLFADQKPSEDTDIVIVCVGLQAQLSFTGKYKEKDINGIIKAVKSKPYVGKIMTAKELEKSGAMEGFADLLISPKVPYSFKTTYDKAYIARGQHDSMEEEAQHVFALMWGKGIRKDYEYKQRVSIIDFAPTMAELLKIKKPANSTGTVLKKALK